MLKIVQQFTWRDVLFSVKTFVAAMLALFIAFHLNLSQPSWSLTTVYIVSQPLAGMVLAKSVFRILGTVIGAVMSLVFVGLFSNAPELFCLVLALWIGAGTFVSVYLRDVPQAYTGMLAGYSAAIIGLPAALAPDTAFDFAVARCLEILLGIACAALMHHVVFPRRAGDALRKALATTLPTMAQWVSDALRGQEGEAKGLADRRQLISAILSLGSLRTFAALDTPAIRVIDSAIRQFQGKLLSLLALLVSVYDRFAILQRDQPTMAEELRPLLERVVAHVAETANASTSEQSRQETALEASLAADVQSRLPPAHALRSHPQNFLVRSILLRLNDILAMWQELIWIRTHIAANIRLPGEGAAPSFQPYRDATFALIGGAISAVTVLIASAFWIQTAWPNGPAAVTFAGVMCAIMGARDDPAAAALTFLKVSVVGAMIAGFYLFVLLPPLNTFPALVVALAPFYLICGVFLTAPAAVPFVIPAIFIGGGLMGVSNQMTYDFAAFLNSFLGYMAGIGIGAMALALLRPLGSEWIVQRLTRGTRADLARVAGGQTPESRASFESRMFDRINALLTRLDPLVDDQRAAMQGGLASLRIGLNILALRRYRLLLPGPAARAVDRALAALATCFDKAARQGQMPSPLSLLQVARNRVLAQPEEDLLIQTAEALYGIETTLRQHAGFFGLPEPSPSATTSIGAVEA
ncbi:MULTISPECIES: FUSC family protein [unclassified Beijerinckia]|uniref:FUSC family protein n=1 Tax=unclassified Beijerinckia TaxID=2638183 RepID=UPI000895B49C|nr:MULTISPECIES: FUSC family protein [unclassified Beijerinckia]MDH7795049.1 putative membrane protein YccC [Beijerinckia sp. GAS462]SEB85497.1 Uncharacterized membrane protein YccC [Beijerinckia sp. 28-YEA-48]